MSEPRTPTEEKRIKVSPGFNSSVPCRTVLFEVSIPTEEYMQNLPRDYAPHFRIFAVQQCSADAEIAAEIFGGPVEFVESNGEHNGYWRPKKP